jgi:hypothetical protein
LPQPISQRQQQPAPPDRLEMPSSTEPFLALELDRLFPSDRAERVDAETRAEVIKDYQHRRRSQGYSW